MPHAAVTGGVLPSRMPSAPYTLTLEPRDRYLRAQVSGPEDTVEVSVAYWSEIAAACRDGAVRRLLVVEELEGTAQPSEMEAVVGFLLQLGFQDIRIAFVDATEDAALLVRAEIQVQKHGVTARVFRRESEAERWLLGDIAPAPDRTA
jgi:hypothetical protein